MCLLSFLYQTSFICVWCRITIKHFPYALHANSFSKSFIWVSYQFIPKWISYAFHVNSISNIVHMRFAPINSLTSFVVSFMLIHSQKSFIWDSFPFSLKHISYAFHANPLFFVWAHANSLSRIFHMRFMLIHY